MCLQLAPNSSSNRLGVDLWSFVSHGIVVYDPWSLAVEAVCSVLKNGGKLDGLLMRAPDMLEATCVYY